MVYSYNEILFGHKKKCWYIVQLVVVAKLLSHVWLFATSWTEASQLLCPPLSPGVCSDSCPLSQWCYLTISSSATPFSFCFQSFPTSGSFPMNQVRWPNWLFSNNPFNEYSRLISFRIDWFDLLALQVTLKSLLQNHNSKASILQLSVFCRVHLSHLYTTTGKTIALTIWIFVRKQSLLLNMLPRFVIAFHPRSIFPFYGCSHHLERFWSPRK